MQVRIKWLFFDVGNTLVDESEADYYLLRRLEEAIGPRRRFSRKSFSGWVLGLFDSRTVSGYRSLTDYLCTTGLIKRETADSILSDVGMRYLELWKLYDDAVRVVPTLSEEYELGIIANQPARIRGWLAERRLLSYWKCISISEETGVNKPDPKIFSLALGSVGANPAESVMIGDRLDADIKPAKMLGLRTIRVRRGILRNTKPLDQSEESTATVDSLDKVPKVLGILKHQSAPSGRARGTKA